MMMPERFERICEQQSVTLGFDIQKPDASFNPPVTDDFLPTGMLRTITGAARVLRKDPTQALIDRPIGISPEIHHDLAAETLARMLNATIEPVRLAEGANFTAEGQRNIDTCSFSEYAFARSLRGLKKPDKISYFDGSQIILDDQEMPLFIRKSLGVISSISLAPFTINGIPYPAGSMVRLELGSDYIDETGDVYGLSSEDEVSIVPIENVTGVSFKRLSAFAFPAGERHAFTQAYTHLEPSLRRIVKWSPLANIVERAQQAIATIDATSA